MRIYVFTNVAFAHKPETNFWSERKRSVEKSQSLELASLPPGIALPSPTSGLLPESILTVPLRLKSPSFLQSLPLAYGSIRNVSTAHQSISPVVLHIQDVHMNQEAQENIGHTLQELINQKKVDLVALEGAFDPISLPGFGTFPHQDIVKAVADYLLRENSISGPIYTLLTSSSKKVPVFVGVDDRALYQANVEAYKESSGHLRDYKNQWRQLDQELTQEKASAFNPDLLAFDKEVEAYHRNLIKAGDYIKFLTGETGQSSPNIKVFLEALDLESRLNFSQVESQRSELLSQLVKKLKKQEISDLLTSSVAYRLGQMSHVQFYEYLRTLCRDGGLPLKRYPAMGSYIRYVLLSDRINPENLLEEVRTLEEDGYASLAKTPPEKKLVLESQHLELIGKLLDFALTSEEWQEYVKLKDTRFLSRFPALPAFEDFYREAELRDRAMTRNLLKAMEKNKSKVAVLVTGGFHSQGMDQKLKEHGIGTISFVPKITHVDSDKGSAYLSVFTQEKTPLDKLFQGEKLFLCPLQATKMPLAALAIADISGNPPISFGSCRRRCLILSSSLNSSKKRTGSRKGSVRSGGNRNQGRLVGRAGQRKFAGCSDRGEDIHRRSAHLEPASLASEVDGKKR